MAHCTPFKILDESDVIWYKALWCISSVHICTYINSLGVRNLQSSLTMVTVAWLTDVRTFGSELLSTTVNCSSLSTTESSMIGIETSTIAVEEVRLRVLLIEE